ncbi:MAG: MoaD/ThiS family protein [Gammaproteobacteria bacterium]|nr:MoaD/ThiS family protein [Gammaproteobacteria bacterium]
MIKVVFFASLKEKLGCDSISVAFQPDLDTERLIKHLSENNSSWRDALSNNILTAVNHELKHSNTKLADDDEVAFFPPVTGG